MTLLNTLIKKSLRLYDKILNTDHKKIYLFIYLKKLHKKVIWKNLNKKGKEKI